MPVRPLTTSVLRWPNREAVHAALVRWAQDAVKRDRSIRKVGYFGSYARGDWGVGSDLDLVLIRDESAPGVALPDTTELPVAADVTVFTEIQWRARVARQDRFARTLYHETVWVHPTAASVVARTRRVGSHTDSER